MRHHSYHHGDLHRALIDAALAIVSRQGTKALTLREVARRAGVSHAAPYHHFSDKAALLAAVAEDGFRKMHGEMIDLCAKAGPDSGKQLRAVGVAYVRFAVSHPSQFRVMFSPDIAKSSSSPSLKEASQATFRMLVDGLARLAPESEETVMEVALASWALMHGLAVLWNDGQLDIARSKATTAEAMAERCAELLSDGAELHMKNTQSPPANAKTRRRR
jgi:AcrR family transcriptional regulator